MTPPRSQSQITSSDRHDPTITHCFRRGSRDQAGRRHVAICIYRLSHDARRARSAHQSKTGARRVLIASSPPLGPGICPRAPAQWCAGVGASATYAVLCGVTSSLALSLDLVPVTFSQFSTIYGIPLVEARLPNCNTASRFSASPPSQRKCMISHGRTGLVWYN